MPLTLQAAVPELEVAEEAQMFVDDAPECDAIGIFHTAGREQDAHEHLMQMPVAEHLALAEVVAPGQSA
jgi:hypothetical protein